MHKIILRTKILVFFKHCNKFDPINNGYSWNYLEANFNSSLVTEDNNIYKLERLHFPKTNKIYSKLNIPAK